jgi:hypothetical protein
MMQIYFGYELFDTDLREACEFTDEDIHSVTKAQIDFIIVADRSCEELPYYLAIHLNGMYSSHTTTFRGAPKSIFIYWHD